MGHRESSGHEASTKLHEISTRIHWKRPRRLKIGFGGKKKFKLFVDCLNFSRVLCIVPAALELIHACLGVHRESVD